MNVTSFLATSLSCKSVVFCSLPGQHWSWRSPQAEGAGSAQHTGTRIQNVLSGENLSDSRVVFCVDLNLNYYSAVLFSVPAGALASGYELCG